MCNDPPPEFEGNICEGSLVQVQMCKGKRRKCKSSNKVTGTSKLSLPLGFYLQECCLPKNLANVEASGGNINSIYKTNP